MEEEIIECLESNRIDVDIECGYCDPTGSLKRELDRANDMLDECIASVRYYFKNKTKGDS